MKALDTLNASFEIWSYPFYIRKKTIAILQPLRLARGSLGVVGRYFCLKKNISSKTYYRSNIRVSESQSRSSLYFPFPKCIIFKSTCTITSKIRNDQFWEIKSKLHSRTVVSMPCLQIIKVLRRSEHTCI